MDSKLLILVLKMLVVEAALVTNSQGSNTVCFMNYFIHLTLVWR